MDNLRVNKIIEISPTEVLVSSERAGIQKLDLSGLDNGVVDAYRYGQEDGLLATDPAGRSVISQVNGQIIASTDNGFFVFDYNAFSPTAMDGLADLVPPGTVLDFVEQGETWAYTYNRLFKKNGAWYEEDVARLSEGGFETVSYLGDQLVVGGLGNILVFDNKGERPEPAAPPVTLSLVARYSGDLEPQLLPLDDVEFSTKDRLTLKYAVADFYDPNQVRYRTRLEPNETQFSDWSSSSEQSLVALAPGEYTFRVEAKDSLNQVSRLAVPITVAPQWFETHWFRITVAITVFAALYFLGTYAMRRRSRLLALERDRLETMVSERTRALESANKQLDQMAHLDGLTQIPNRRRLDSYLDDVWRQCVDRNRMMAIAIIDVDDFKKYNDTHGHQAGDELLVSLAQTLSANLRRAEDLVARYGGEDFLVVLPGAEESTAKQVIEEMRRQVETSDLGVTVSAGIHANTPHNAMPLEQMISTADRALYQSKSEGRNRVTVLS
ncbi:MAG: diguanylate cyclase [Pseudomonadales bacterium]|nr:diguanylate cyclase [Pseudomonadales bacterium]